MKKPGFGNGSDEEGQSGREATGCAQLIGS
jgi:hypothetical protein